MTILVDSSSPAENDTSWSLRQIFGADVGFERSSEPAPRFDELVLSGGN